jgi:hypothetical protein
MSSSKIHKQVTVNGCVVNAVVVDEFSLNNYIEKDTELMELASKENEKKEKKTNIRAKDIKVVSGILPSKSEIVTLCQHGHLNKINMIEQSYFTKEVRNELIPIMKKKIEEIKKWLTEDENQSPTKIGYLNHRKNNIYKIIRYFNNFDKSSGKNGNKW